MYFSYIGQDKYNDYVFLGECYKDFMKETRPYPRSYLILGD